MAETKEGADGKDAAVRSRLRRCRKWLYGLRLPVWGPVRWLYAALYWAGHAGAEAWRVISSFFLWAPLFTARCTRVGKRLNLERLPFITGGGCIEVGDDVRISGKINIAFTTRIHPHPALRVGDRVFIGHACSFTIAQEIAIGDDCLIAGGVQVRDNDGHPLDPEARRRRDPVTADTVAPVRIGANAWIGSRAIILKGVVIGENAVVAAESVVTKDVPPNTIVAGNPARAIRTVE